MLFKQLNKVADREYKPALFCCMKSACNITVPTTTKPHIIRHMPGVVFFIFAFMFYAVMSSLLAYLLYKLVKLLIELYF